MTLRVQDIGPAVALQDLGRPGFISLGLTQGGAADRLAVLEGAALLGQGADLAVLEMVGTGGTFKAESSTVVAMTGATMRGEIDGAPIAWNASYRLDQDQVVKIGPVLEGTYGYLHIAGGFAAKKVLGGVGAHLSVGLGRLVQSGDLLTPHPCALPDERTFAPDPRLDGGTLRVIPSMQTHLFAGEERDRLSDITFTRDPRADRQGIKLNFDGPAFSARNALSIVSEIAVPGDVQIGGDGRPMILLSEGQTTAGYPRIGTVLPCDMPRAVQCPTGAQLRLEWVTVGEARAIEAAARAAQRMLGQRATARVRGPMDIANLRDYNLISGATTGD